MKNRFFFQVIIIVLMQVFTSREAAAGKLAPDTMRYWRMHAGVGLPFYEVNAFAPVNDRSYVPFYLRAETDITHWFSAGVAMGYAQRESSLTVPDYLPDGKNRTISTEYTADAFFGGLRMNFIYKYKKIECYAGFTGGFKHLTKTSLRKEFVDGNQVSESSINEVPGNPYYMSGTIGLNYYPAKNIGIFLEAGHDFSAIAKAGVALRFGK